MYIYVQDLMKKVVKFEIFLEISGFFWLVEGEKWWFFVKKKCNGCVKSGKFLGNIWGICVLMIVCGNGRKFLGNGEEQW